MSRTNTRRTKPTQFFIDPFFAPWSDPFCTEKNSQTILAQLTGSWNYDFLNSSTITVTSPKDDDPYDITTKSWRFYGNDCVQQEAWGPVYTFSPPPTINDTSAITYWSPFNVQELVIPVTAIDNKDGAVCAVKWKWRLHSTVEEWAPVFTFTKTKILGNLTLPTRLTVPSDSITLTLAGEHSITNGSQWTVDGSLSMNIPPLAKRSFADATVGGSYGESLTETYGSSGSVTYSPALGPRQPGLYVLAYVQSYDESEGYARYWDKSGFNCPAWSRWIDYLSFGQVHVDLVRVGE